MKKRLETLFAEYGAIAITIYLTIFVVTLSSFAIALRTGFEVDGVAGNSGTLAAAWVATKLTQPLRIIATVLLTPVVAGILHRFRRVKPVEIPALVEPIQASPEPEVAAADSAD